MFAMPMPGGVAALVATSMALGLWPSQSPVLVLELYQKLLFFCLFLFHYVAH